MLTLTAFMDGSISTSSFAFRVTFDGFNMAAAVVLNVNVKAKCLTLFQFRAWNGALL